MSEVESHGEASPSRRRLIKTGVAATGVAFVAPQILNTAVAGAETMTCYGFKIGEGNLNPGPPISDPACDGSFNSNLNAAFEGSTTNLDSASGQALVSVTSGGLGQANATVEITSANCTFAFAGFKAADACFDDSGDSVTISGGGKTATIVSPDQGGPPGPAVANISHMTFVVCCTGSPAV
jgi:hypothetical protein